MSNQGKWKLHSELNRIIMQLRNERNDKNELEIATLIVELAAIRDRIDKLLGK